MITFKESAAVLWSAPATVVSWVCRCTQSVCCAGWGWLTASLKIIVTHFYLTLLTIAFKINKFWYLLHRNGFILRLMSRFQINRIYINGDLRWLTYICDKICWAVRAELDPPHSPLQSSMYTSRHGCWHQAAAFEALWLAVKVAFWYLARISCDKT